MIIDTKNLRAELQSFYESECEIASGTKDNTQAVQLFRLIENGRIENESLISKVEALAKSMTARTAMLDAVRIAVESKRLEARESDDND